MSNFSGCHDFHYFVLTYYAINLSINEKKKGMQVNVYLKVEFRIYINYELNSLNLRLSKVKFDENILMKLHLMKTLMKLNLMKRLIN